MRCEGCGSGVRLESVWDECCGWLQLHDHEEACAADAGSQVRRLEVGSWNRDEGVGENNSPIANHSPLFIFLSTAGMAKPPSNS